MRRRARLVIGLLASLGAGPAWADGSWEHSMVTQDPAFVKRNVRQEPKGEGIPVYDAQNCVGPVVEGVCHGTMVPEGRPLRCHGKMIRGECTGPIF
jgi:hypothetical protein